MEDAARRGLVRVLSASLHESRALSFGPREALETALQDHIRILEDVGVDLDG
jgi:hypothetical protein